MMLRRILMPVLVLLTVTAVAVIVAANWVIRSNDGARWALGRSLPGTSVMQDLKASEGDLSGGLKIPRLTLQTDAGRLSAESVYLQVSVEWLPPALEIQRLEVDHLRLEPSAQPSTANTSPGRPAVDARAPIPIRLNKLVIHHLDLAGPGDSSWIKDLALTANGAWNERIEWRLAWDAPGSAGNGDSGGWVQLTPPYRHQLEARLKPGPGLIELSGLADDAYRVALQGDTNDARFELQSDPSGLSASGQARLQDDGLHWSLNGRVAQWPSPRNEDGGLFSLTDVELQAEGRDSVYRASASTTIDADSLGPVRGEVRVAGDLQGIEIESLQLRSAAAEIDASGGYRWGETAHLDLLISLGRLDPSPWLASWPGDRTVRGSANLAWFGERIELSGIDIGISGEPARLTGSGMIDPGAQQLEGQFALMQFRWPLDGPATLTSRKAELLISGQPDAWEAEGVVTLQVGDHPETSLRLGAVTSGTEVRVELAPSPLLGGEVRGSALFDRRTPSNWKSRLEGRQVQTAPLWPDWPGQLDLTLGLTGAMASGSLAAEIESLSGELMGERIDARGRIDWTGATLSVDQLELEAGDSRLTLDGDLDNGLSFDVRSHDSPLLARWLSGDIVGEGRVRMTAGLPEAEVNVRVERLKAGELQIERAQVSGQFSTEREGAASLWTAEHVVLGQFGLDRLEGQLTREGEVQRWVARLAHGEQQLELAAAGHLRGLATPSDLTWSGALEQLDYLRAEEPLIRLAHPAQFTLAQQVAQLQNLCLELEPGGQACATVDWRSGQSTGLEVQIDALPLSTLAQLFGQDIRASQALSGKLWWRHALGGRPSGAADLNLLTPPTEEEPQPEPGLFRFSLQDGELSQGRFYLPIAGAGLADIEFAINDFTLDGNGQLQGRARLDLDDLSFLQDILSRLEPTGGRLDVDARLGGRVAEPQLDGWITVDDAAFNLPALGLFGVRLNLSGRVDRTDRLALRGTLESGPGQAEINAAVNVSDWEDAQLGVTVKGERLALTDVPSLKVLVNPDVHVSWRPGKWTVGGALLIPEARVSPVGSIEGHVNESADVEIVAGTLPDRATSRPDAVPLRGQLQLILGDDVRVDMPAVKMRGTGALDLEWQGAWVPLANGQLILNGEVKAFGPRLVVENGPVRFSNRALDDPLLDIRAERDIFGNTQIRTAGVHIRGTAKRPVIEAYTVPVTNEDRAWALLVTGSDFEYGQGIGAFDIGTYIAPRLYISYGVSIFDEDRSVSARYDLRKGFGIKATASEQDNGIDASFTVER